MLVATSKQLLYFHYGFQPHYCYDDTHIVDYYGYNSCTEMTLTPVRRDLKNIMIKLMAFNVISIFIRFFMIHM